MIECYVVLIVDGLSRVRTEPSKDGQIRRVHVRLGSGKTIERPAVKIARLDIGPT